MTEHATLPSKTLDKPASFSLIERIGNSLPHPFLIFCYLALTIVALSALLSTLGAGVNHPGTGEWVGIKSLVSRDGLQWILTSALGNFVEFKPLGLVLAMTLGIGLAEGVGLIQTALREALTKVPARFLTYMIFIMGIVGNLASDAAVVIIPPIAAMIFHNAGRHPVAGLVAGFAAVSSGFTANFFITGTDALLSGISTEAIEGIKEGVTVTPVSNWYFMSASVIFLGSIGVFVTEKIIEPRLGIYSGDYKEEIQEPTTQEKKALLWAGITAMAFLALLLSMVVPSGGLLRDSIKNTIIPSPFLEGLVPIIILFFIITSSVYGFVAGTIKTASDIPDKMIQAMGGMTGFLVIAFAMAQFIAYFKWTNMSVWVAVTGGQLLQDAQFTGIPLILSFIGFAALLNLFIVSGSAQWALMAPVFLPMMMVVGFHPAFVQLCFRIADSSTNTISPLNVYVPMVLVFLQRYDKRAGLGSLISLMVPYAVIFLLTWTVLLLIWMWLGLDVGVASSIFL